jgi:hypothetical protein
MARVFCPQASLTCAVSAVAAAEWRDLRQKVGFVSAAHSAYPAAQLNRHFSQSPIDALINFVVRGRLRHHTQIWLNFKTFANRRVAAISQRLPTFRGQDSANGRFGEGKSQIATTAMGLQETFRKQVLLPAVSVGSCAFRLNSKKPKPLRS